MAVANPLWAAPRVHGELLKLGFEISRAAVSKDMVPHRKPPSQNWRRFLTSHAKDIVSIDVFTVPTSTCRVLFVFLILSHDRRWVVYFNVTATPSAAWTGQQIIEAFPLDTTPRYLLRDRDGIYGHGFIRSVGSITGTSAGRREGRLLSIPGHQGTRLPKHPRRGAQPAACPTSDAR